MPSPESSSVHAHSILKSDDRYQIFVHRASILDEVMFCIRYASIGDFQLCHRPMDTVCSSSMSRQGIRQQVEAYRL